MRQEKLVKSALNAKMSKQGRLTIFSAKKRIIKPRLSLRSREQPSKPEGKHATLNVRKWINV